MKLEILCLTFALIVPSVPGAAQMHTANTLPRMPQPNLTHPDTSPQAMQALAAQLFREGERVHHHDRTPQQRAREDARMDRINDLTQAGTQALHLKNFAAAEADYRELLQVTATPQMAPQTLLGPAPYYGLGEALAGQGKTADAIAAYKLGVYYPLNFTPEAVAVSQAIENKPNLRGCSFPTDAVAWMKYVLLLSQTGQNAEAFSVYIQALRLAPDTAHPDMKISFATGQPAPTELQSAAHIALGLLVNNTGNDREQALSEFEQARKLAPDTAAANYYYGYGWKRLDPNSPAKAAHAQEAKAALAKAAASDDGSIKEAATEEAKGL